MAKQYRRKFCYNWLRKKPQFKGLTGVTDAEFQIMLSLLRPIWRRDVVAAKLKSGRPWDISTKNDDGLSDHLLVLLVLYRCHITQEFLGCLYGVDKSAICRAKARIEAIAVELLGVKSEIKVQQEEAHAMIVDCTEQPCERPKRRQKKYYSGKKKRHTIKAEIVISNIDGKNRILSLPPPVPGSIHDLTLRRKGPILPKGSYLHADSAYQGYKVLDSDICIPYKRSKNRPLTTYQKEFNRDLSSFRVAVEHVFGKMKVFRILKETWRYPKLSWHKTARIIAGITNLKAGFSPC